MVSTLDFESSDPSSNLGRTCHVFLDVNLYWLRGATVARLTPDQKAACSNHVGVKIFFPQSDCDTFVQKVCLQWGLNSWPLVYKTNALPLSYRGPRCVGDKMQQNCLGDTRIWTMDLSDCSRLLYHWAISPRPMLEVWSAQIHVAGECGWGTCALRSNRVSTASVV